MLAKESTSESFMRASQFTSLIEDSSPTLAHSDVSSGPSKIQCPLQAVSVLESAVPLVCQNINYIVEWQPCRQYINNKKLNP